MPNDHPYFATTPQSGVAGQGVRRTPVPGPGVVGTQSVGKGGGYPPNGGCCRFVANCSIYDCELIGIPAPINQYTARPALAPVSQAVWAGPNTTRQERAGNASVGGAVEGDRALDVPGAAQLRGGPGPGGRAPPPEMVCRPRRRRCLGCNRGSAWVGCRCLFIRQTTDERMNGCTHFHFLFFF